MSYSKYILITGGAGFIGSYVVTLFVNNYHEYRIINLNKLTYTGNLNNLRDVEDKPNYIFEKADICDFELILAIFKKYDVADVVHLAAESHVDRSIKDPFTFTQTNVMGTLSLLQAARIMWEEDYEKHLFFHISTDEIYCDLDFDDTLFTETTSYVPHSPYSESKADSDHFLRSYRDTYGMHVNISNCSNNYEPFQCPEKIIPLFINNIRNDKSLPVYSKGENVRDWLYVVDHARAIDLIFHEWKRSETYNIGGHNEWTIINLIQLLCKLIDKKLDRLKGTSKKLITYVKDRASHDARYAIRAGKIERELEWAPILQFEKGLSKTIDWYIDNQDWLDSVINGDYLKYYEHIYSSKY